MLRGSVIYYAKKNEVVFIDVPNLKSVRYAMECKATVKCLPRVTHSSKHMTSMSRRTTWPALI